MKITWFGHSAFRLEFGTSAPLGLALRAGASGIDYRDVTDPDLVRFLSHQTRGPVALLREQRRNFVVERGAGGDGDRAAPPRGRYQGRLVRVIAGVEDGAGQARRLEGTGPSLPGVKPLKEQGVDVVLGNCLGPGGDPARVAACSMPW